MAIRPISRWSLQEYLRYLHWYSFSESRSWRRHSKYLYRINQYSYIIIINNYTQCNATAESHSPTKNRWTEDHAQQGKGIGLHGTKRTNSLWEFSPSGTWRRGSVLHQWTQTEVVSQNGAGWVHLGRSIHCAPQLWAPLSRHSWWRVLRRYAS